MNKLDIEQSGCDFSDDLLGFAHFFTFKHFIFKKLEYSLVGLERLNKK